ncbi:MAG: hypothetical protein R3F37_15740 [Candidatus Competibacteraceae bacterium]
MTVLASCSLGNDPKPSPKLDTELVNAAHSAQRAFATGQYQTAAAQYRLALQRARVMDDAGAIGNQAYNLALSLIALDRLSEAQTLLDEAEQALARAGAPLADVWLARAKLTYLMIGRDEANPTELERLLRQLLDDPRSRLTDLHRAQVAVLRADLAGDRGDIASAAAQWAESRKYAATEPALSTVQAQIARVNGRILLLCGEPAQAARQFDEESRIMRLNRLYRDMAKALSRSGAAYQRAELPELAIARFYRAASSWLGQERPTEMERDLAAAEQLADTLNDPVWQRRLAALRGETVGQSEP